MSPRAPALSRDDRRAAIIDATVPLLREHGRAVTTKQIAEAAGIAEGTIFRVFATKDAVIDAAIPQAFDRSRMLAELAAIDRSLPLRARLTAFVTVLQTQFVAIFDLMAALGFVAPPQPPAPDRKAAWRESMRRATVGLVDPKADCLTVDAETLLRYVRLLTFSGSHPGIADGHLLTPAEIVDLVLDGMLCRDPDSPAHRRPGRNADDRS